MQTHHVKTYYPFVEVLDDYGHHYTTRYGRSTHNIDQALRTLRRCKHGEIRDEHNVIVAIKDPACGLRILQ